MGDEAWSGLIEVLDLQSRSPLSFVAAAELLGLSYEAAKKRRQRAVPDDARLPAYLNPHCLRHTHATSLIELGWPMQLVRELMGYTYVATTAI